jgi:hypothetical protein
MRPVRTFVFIALIAFSFQSCSKADAGPDPDVRWLADRAAMEKSQLATTPVVSDFSFGDSSESRGVTFVNRIVDDAGRTYKAVHYDHGVGLCAADVDGDSRTDLYFVSQLGTSELWRGAGNGRYTAATDAAGLRMDNVIAVGCAFGDYDNDGRPDLFVTTVRHGNRLFHNIGDGRFTDVTAEAGVGYVGHSSGSTFFDYNGDGLLDLFVSNVGAYTTQARGNGGYFVGVTDAFQGHLHPDRSETSILYRNVGNGKFRDVSRETGIADSSWSGDATILDANEDGRPDLYVLNMQGEDHLWLNEGGTRFRDVTRKYFPRTPWGTMGVKVFDYNRDGRLDLFLTDMHSDMFADIPKIDWLAERQKAIAAQIPDFYFPTGKSQFILGNALFENRSTPGKASFVERSDELGVETYWPWGPSVDDINADGWDDILVINSMNYPFRYAPNAALLNVGGRRFAHAEFTLGVEPPPGGATMQTWFNDGKADVPGARGARSSLLVDIDGDGDLDVVTNEFNAAPRFLVSNLAQRRPVHSLQVRLQGRVSNRQGIGARVTVVLEDGSRTLKRVDGKSGYLSQSDLPLYFGLGGAAGVAAIEVRWPSGRTQRLGPTHGGQTVTIVEQ